MSELSRRFNPSSHPRVMAGAMNSDDAMVDLEEGIDLERSGQVRGMIMCMRLSSCVLRIGKEETCL